MSGRNEYLMRLYVREQGPVPYSQAARAEFAHTFATGITVGRGSSPGTPLVTGEARGGWVLDDRPATGRPPAAAYYAVIGAVDVDRVVKRTPLSRPLVFSNNVDHTNILAGGRRPDRNGRMIGSIQAPDGFLEQSDNEARSHLRGWGPSRSRMREFDVLLVGRV